MLGGSTNPPPITTPGILITIGRWEICTKWKPVNTETFAWLQNCLFNSSCPFMSMVGCYFQDCWEIFFITRGDPVNIHKKSIAVDIALDHLFIGNTFPWPGLSFTLCYLFYSIQVKVKMSLTKHSFRLIFFQYLTHLIKQAFLHVQYKYIRADV